MKKTQVQFLVQEDPLYKEMATRSSILAWRIPRTEEPDKLLFMGSQESQHDLVTKPPPVFLPGEPHGQRSLAGYSPGATKELDMT